MYCSLSSFLPTRADVLPLEVGELAAYSCPPEQLRHWHHAYLKKRGKVEMAQNIANHQSPRTTELYDRREEEISLGEVERILI